MSKALPYFGGIPTKPDVDKILKQFGVPEDGAVITYEEVEAVIETKNDGDTKNRFRTVTNAWRSALERNHNVIVRVEPGVGFVIATASDRVNLGMGKLREATKKLKKADVRFNVPSSKLSSLTDEERKKHDAGRLAIAKMKQTYREVQRQLPSGK